MGCGTLLGLDDFEDAPSGEGAGGNGGGATSNTTSTSSVGGGASTSTSTSGSGGMAQGGGGSGGMGGAPVCGQGETMPCYTGDPLLPGHGACVAGTATCLPDGSGFGDCEGEVLPTPEDCATQVDDNCDGNTNENCPCNPGDSATCYSGPAGSEVNTPCKPGVQICNNDGLGYGPCMGEVIPQMEVCDANLVDEDCDGMPNDGCACVPGTTTTCYTGPAGTQNVGICKGGTAICAQDGLGYGACMGEVVPGAETCAATADEDCDTKDCAVWSKGLDALTAMDADGQGNIYLALSTASPINLGGGLLTPAGNSDLVIAKLDAAGNHVWSKIYGDAQGQGVSTIDVDSTGNIAVAGLYGGTMNFGGGAIASQGSSDLYVAKLDTNGNQIWAKTFHPSTSVNSKGIGITAGGDVALAGSFQGTLNFGGGTLTSSGSGTDDIYVAKLKGADGGQLWASKYGDSAAQYVHTLGVDPGGNIIVAGIYTGTLALGNPSLVAAGYDLYFAVFNGNGSLVCRAGITSTDSDFFTAVGVDSASNIVLAGSFYGTLNFGGANISNGGGAAYGQIFLAQLTSACVHKWSKAVGDPLNSEYSSDMAVMNGTDDIVVAMNSAAGIDLGGGPLPGYGNTDVAIAKFSPLGAHLWSRSFGDPNYQDIPILAALPGERTAFAFLNQGTVDLGAGPVSSAKVLTALGK